MHFAHWPLILVQREGERKPVVQELNRLPINACPLFSVLFQDWPIFEVNLQNCLQCNLLQNGVNFEGGIAIVYKGINGVKNTADQTKIKIDFNLINLRFNPIRSVFSCIKNGLGQLQMVHRGSDITASRIRCFFSSRQVSWARAIKRTCRFNCKNLCRYLQWDVWHASNARCWGD